YKANDGTDDSNVATVTIQVTNSVPTANSDGPFFVHQGQHLDFSATNGVLSNDTDADGDSLTATMVDYPTQGYMVFNSDGSFYYYPNSSVTALTDSFSYKANDSAADSDVV